MAATTVKKPRAPRKTKVAPVVQPTSQVLGGDDLATIPTKGLRSRRSYSAAATGWRNDGWITSGASANAEIMGGIAAVRERARDLERNAPWGAAIVQKLTTYLIGTGIRPDLQTGDKKLDAKALALFERWAKKATPDGLGFYGMQLLLASSWIVSGEVLGRRRARFPADMQDHHGQLPPVQVQPIEADLLDHTYNTMRGGNRIIQGVEYNPIDQRVFYHLFKQHPGEAFGAFGLNGFSASQERLPVSADNMFHLYELRRPGQVRAVSWLASIVQALWDYDSYADAERVRAKSAACLVASVEGGDPANGEPTGVDGMAPATDSEGTPVVDSTGAPVEQLAPGLILYAPNGKKIVFNETGAQSNTEFVRNSLREIAAGVSLDYITLSMDMSQGNFSFHKMAATERKTRMAQLRERFFAPLALEPTWRWFVDAAISSRLLPDDPRLYDVQWSCPQMESADRGAEISADQKDVRSGFKSRRQVIRDRGYDPDLIDADLVLDKKNREALGLVLDSDPEKTSLSGGVQPLVLTNEEA